MPGVEYSPNNRAHCQKCGGKIKKDQVRVSTLSSSGRGAGDYTKQFTHAECYTGRTDFTKFFGFRDLWPLDQKRFMTEKQKRANYPQDYVVEEKVVAVAPVMYGDVAAVPSVNEFVDNDDDELANFDMDAAISSYATVSKEGSAGSPPVAAKPSSRSEPQKKHAIYNVGPVLMIGLKSAHARAVPGEKVTLVRDPGNIYDSNALKVINSYNQRVGYIQGKVAYPVSKALDKRRGELIDKRGVEIIMMGTVVDVGDGVTQTLQVQVTTTDVATKTNQSNENEVAKPAAIAGKDTQKPKVMTVVGLNHAKVRATSGENVTLIREPENKYDPNAIKVVNSSNEQIGHIKATDAGPMSKTWDSLNNELKSKGERMAAIGTILDDGDGYKQLVQVEYKQVTATKANHNEAEVATSTAGVSTPKRVKTTAVAVPVTVSAKKARR